MAIAYRSNSVSRATASPSTPSEPSGAAAGDFLIAVGMVWADASSFAAPSGWTVLYSGDSLNTLFRYIVCWIVRGSSAPSYAFTFTGTPTLSDINVLAFSGGHLTTPIDSQSASGATANGQINPDPPATTVVAANCMAICGGVSRGGGTPWAAPSGYTMGSANAVDDACCVAYKLLTAGGTENPGAFSGVLAADRDYWHGFTISLAPASAGAPDLSVTLQEPTISLSTF